MRLRLEKAHLVVWGNDLNIRLSLKRNAALLAGAALVSLSGCGGHGAANVLGLTVPGSATQSAASQFVIGQVPESNPPMGGPPHQPPPHGQGFFPDTTVGIHALQIFDQDHGNMITIGQGIADGSRYASVWGVRTPSMAVAWHTNNVNLNALIYTPFDTDATGSGLNEPTSWWLANHPDWILYECDRSTIAYVGGLSGVPLDISNPAVIKYQMSLLGGFAEANGYNGVAADIVSLDNNTGHVDSGHGGCGVWQANHTVWVQKFSGAKSDPAWATAAIGWVTSAHAALHNPRTYSRPLALAINTAVNGYVAPVNGVGGDPGERAIIGNADIVLNESGFADWGGYVSDHGLVNAVGWMEYAQSLGEGTLVADDWNRQHQPPTIPQLDYSIATYLMGKEQAAALYVGSNSMYGKENYYPQYHAAVGTACAPMYGGPSDPPFTGEDVFFRKYSGALAVVNVSAKKTYVVKLPKSSYTSIEGGQVKSPLSILPDTGYVLLTTNGCS